jgi:DNA repair photolyase
MDARERGVFSGPQRREKALAGAAKKGNMPSTTPFEIIEQRPLCYEIPGFEPLAIDRGLLVRAGIDYPISDEVDRELVEGSRRFRELFLNRRLAPENAYAEANAPVDEELEIHNYTGLCPTNVLEVTPSKGSCACACQYCLVTDGNHIVPISVYTNYIERLRNSLQRNSDRALFYYYSPKTEAFSEPHLWNGLAHQILRTFIDHYEKHPESQCRIFIASKAGLKHLLVRHRGETVLGLLASLRGRVQYNGSIGIMPDYLRNILEPNVATFEERLEVLQVCQALGIAAESVLAQPLILVYLTPESIEHYIESLARAGVKNIKPEFLTTEVKNLALIAQLIHHYDPQLLRDFFYPYLKESNRGHIKQRSRLAPERAACVQRLELIRAFAEKYGLTISICNWVKSELSKAAAWVGKIDALSSVAGYRCLGYQTRMFQST